MPVKIRAARLEEKARLHVWMRTYLQEISEYGAVGMNYPFFDSYWLESRRWPYFIDREEETAGFLMVNDWSPSKLGTDFSIAEFYILPGFRGAGIGKRAFSNLIQSRPGIWELSVMSKNTPARAFWMRTLATSDVIGTEEIELENEFIYRFSYKL